MYGILSRWIDGASHWLRKKHHTQLKSIHFTRKQQLGI